MKINYIEVWDEYFAYDLKTTIFPKNDKKTENDRERETTRKWKTTGKTGKEKRQ